MENKRLKEQKRFLIKNKEQRIQALEQKGGQENLKRMVTPIRNPVQNLKELITTRLMKLLSKKLKKDTLMLVAVYIKANPKSQLIHLLEQNQKDVQMQHLRTKILVKQFMSMWGVRISVLEMKKMVLTR